MEGGRGERKREMEDEGERKRGRWEKMDGGREGIGKERVNLIDCPFPWCVCRLSARGVRCPEVVVLKKHVLVMSFIGEEMKPAPQLREVQLTPSQLESAYQQCIKVSG